MNAPSLWDLFKTFFRLGSIGFGGPIALIAMMEEECSKRRWIAADVFNRAYVTVKLLPGPIAYQMALWVGHYLRGRRGGVVAGFAFLLPGVALILALTVSYGSLHELNWFSTAMAGMRTATLILIADSLIRMAKPYAKSGASWAYAILAASLMLLFPRWEPIVILGVGAAGILISRAASDRRLNSVLPALFFVHFKAAFLVFGTGFAILPVLERECVYVHQWLTRSEFMDGIAFGQVTPGPITITSVFIGYRAAGLLGSLVSVLGMYLPGIIIMLFILPMIVTRLERSTTWLAFQKGAVAAVLGCLAVTMFLMGRDTMVGWQHWVILAGGAFWVWGMKRPGWIWIPLAGALRLALPA